MSYNTLGPHLEVNMQFVSVLLIQSLQGLGRRQILELIYLGRVKRIWYLWPMRAAKIQTSLRIRAVKICHDGMLEDTNSLDAAHLIS